MLFIARCKGVGANAFRLLLWKFPNDFNCILEFLLREGSKVVLPDKAIIKKELDAIRAVGGGIIFSNDSDFPEKIHSACISYIGDRTLLTKPDRLAVIGSRDVSAKGSLLTRTFMQTWRDRYIIVSGLAVGVDSIAHSCAKKTIAVIGSGLGHYDERSKALRKRIEKEGLVISESRFWSLASHYSFPSRNKIIGAISHAVVLMEAGKKSGTLNTALHTNAMNKTIYAVPGHPTDKQHLGCNKLIERQEAKILLSPNLRIPRQVTLQQQPKILFQEPSVSERIEISQLIDEKHTISDLENQFSPGKVRFMLALRELGLS